MAPKVKPKFTLPASVCGPIEIGRLIRELEAYDEAVLQTGLRHDGADLPKPSSLLNSTLHANNLKLEDDKERAALIKNLWTIKGKAPVLHMSFSADPTSDFTEKIAAWIRQEVHPYALLTIGLQPTIGAGFVLRTTNKYFDASLKQDFAGKKDMLVKLIAETGAKQ